MKYLKSIFVNVFALIRLFLILLVIILSVPGFCITQFNKKWSYAQFQIALFLISKLLGVRVKIFGSPDNIRPLLHVSNHISYIDIISIGGYIKNTFIAKAEIKTWPLIGWMGKLSNVLYMDRRPSAAKEMVKALKKSIQESEYPMMLFAEGTTSNGTYVKEFKSSLFNFMEPQLIGNTTSMPVVSVQPIVIIYRNKYGQKLTEKQISNLAWFDDSKVEYGPKMGRNIPLLEHMFYVLKHGGFTSEIHYLPVVDLTGIKDRKSLAEHLQKIVSDEFNKLK